MKILLTGSDGFTGLHFIKKCNDLDIDIIPLKSDLLNLNDLLEETKYLDIDYVVHLAGISYVAHNNENIFNSVNVIGTKNLLMALKDMKKRPLKILLASSANIYRSIKSNLITESSPLEPINPYAKSKLEMEKMAIESYENIFKFIIVRPFNYTGRGQNDQFLIPKIISHFKRKLNSIELGALDVKREFNDVRYVVDCYISLLKNLDHNEIINICTGNSFSVNDVLNKIQRIANHYPEIKINQDFIRKNEVQNLAGSPKRLVKASMIKNNYSLDQTLMWMYE
jgi:GDP-6-deoxy-D-talose 4-dehydrogenase